MTVALTGEGAIVLTGACDAADAETLLGHLIVTRDATVDWRGCDSVHAAVLQVLLAAGVEPVGPARGRFVFEMLEPLLKQR